MPPKDQQHVPGTPPFCCPSNAIPQSSPYSPFITTFLLALHALSATLLPTSPKPLKPEDPAKSSSSALFRVYPPESPLPQILIQFQTVIITPTQGRTCTRQYLAQLPDRTYLDLQRWPEEGFGVVEERRVDGLWQMGGNWARGDDLGDDRNTGRIGWKCRGCGGQYWVRVVRF